MSCYEMSLVKNRRRLLQIVVLPRLCSIVPTTFEKTDWIFVFEGFFLQTVAFQLTVSQIFLLAENYGYLELQFKKIIYLCLFWVMGF